MRKYLTALLIIFALALSFSLRAQTEEQVFPVLYVNLGIGAGLSTESQLNNPAPSPVLDVVFVTRKALSFGLAYDAASFSVKNKATFPWAPNQFHTFSVLAGRHFYLDDYWSAGLMAGPGMVWYRQTTGVKPETFGGMGFIESHNAAYETEGHSLPGLTLKGYFMLAPAQKFGIQSGGYFHYAGSSVPAYGGIYLGLVLGKLRE